MRIVYLRLTRVLTALVISCVVVVVVLKSFTDTESTNYAESKTLASRHRPAPVAGNPDDLPPAELSDHKQRKLAQDFGERVVPIAGSKLNLDRNVNRPFNQEFHLDDKRFGMDDDTLMQVDNNVVVGRKDSWSKGYPQLKQGMFVPGHRIVHFDLKGAPPRPQFFDQYFAIIKKLGGTGVLLEWEDMFPYTGVLAQAVNKNAYSEADIRAILRSAETHGLEVIPLVQTFGHLEWILKLEAFRKYREVDRFPQVICPSNAKAVSLVKDMVGQVINMHLSVLKKMRFFHIGADEAFQIGACEKCQQRVQHEFFGQRESVMLQHIQDLAMYIHSTFPKAAGSAPLRVILWHDMLNNIDTGTLNNFKLGSLVEPMVWMYAENLDDFLYPDLWQRFATVFPNIWAASAFKGADGPARWFSNVPHYLQNHLSWVQQMTRNYKEFSGEFSGLVLTGWQRFDHFAGLCELFPIGMPSLAVNLQTIVNGRYDRQVLKAASDGLGCEGPLDVESTADSPMLYYSSAARCNFPGVRIYELTQQLRSVLAQIDEQVYNDYKVQGWINRMNRATNYSSVWYLDQVLDTVTYLCDDLRAIRMNLQTELQRLFFEDVASEWIYQYLQPHLDKLQSLQNDMKRMATMRVYPVKPLVMPKEEVTAVPSVPQPAEMVYERRAQDFQG